MPHQFDMTDSEYALLNTHYDTFVELTTSCISININYGYTLINDKVKCIGNIQP